MALAEDLQHDITDLTSIDTAMTMVLEGVRLLPTADGVACVGRYQDQLAALEADLLARNLAGGGTDRDNEKLIDSGRQTSKREAKKRARRAKAVRHNPDLSQDVADGELGVEQLDAIAGASAKSNGDAANDPDLIQEIKDASPDQAGTITKKWLEEHDAPDGEGANKRHARQRRLREVARFDSQDGLAALLLKGDTETIDELFEAIGARSKQLYRADGGRDVAPHKHPRTRKQRLFDAAVELFGLGGSGPQTAASGDGEPSGGSGRARSTIFIWQALEDYLAGNSRATFADGRCVPTVVFERYRCTAELVGALFDAKGELLYQGRIKRYATPAQVRGLIARDRGCVRCGAPPGACEAHHLLPWNAPCKGRTDISNLALVCTDCHHLIHDTRQTLYRDDHGNWRLRPATPDEVAPKHNPIKRE